MHEVGQEHEHDGAAHSGRHLLIMALCCLIPIVLIVVVAIADVKGSYLPLLFVMLCPLMMLLMYLPRLLAKKES